MMITVNRHGGVEDGYISGHYNGIQFGVSFDETKYTEMKRLEDKANNATSVDELQAIIAEFEPMTKESYKETIETKCEWVHVNKHTNKFYLKLPNGRISSKALPKAFVNRILASVDKKIDIMPLVKCWIRILRGKFYTDNKAERFARYIDQTYTNQKLATDLIAKGLSAEVAKARATTTQVGITQEGLLTTYKVVTEVDWKWELDESAEDGKKKVSRYPKTIDEDTGLVTYDKPTHGEDYKFMPCVMDDRGDEFFCGDKAGHIIRVGQTHYLDSWDKVDTDDSRSGVKGLHCGNQDYIRCFQEEGTVTLNIFIDPMDIGAVTNDGTGALRVRRYFVHSIFGGTNRGIYHSSTYAAKTDEEYRRMLEDSIKETGELKDGLDDALEEKKALID